MKKSKVKLFIFIFIISFISCSSPRYREVSIKVDNKEYIDFNRYYYYFFHSKNTFHNILDNFIDKELFNRLSKNLSLKIEAYNEDIFQSKNLRNILFSIDYLLRFNGESFYNSSFFNLEVKLTLIDNFENKPIFYKKYLNQINLEGDNEKKGKSLRLLLNKLSYQIAIDLIKQPQTDYRKIIY